MRTARYLANPIADEATPDFGLLPGSWANEAACRRDPWPDAWHPGGDSVIAVQMAQYALAKCNGTDNTPSCPVRLECLTFALKAEPRDCNGVWGGTTAEQRKNMRKGSKQ